MNNPVLVEIIRGSVVESRHRGAIAVVDVDGNSVLVLGDADAPIFPRSAVKAIQAMPLVESGAADRLGLSDAELALACASHAGEPAHVDGALSMLAKASCTSANLACGAHRPLGEKAASDVVAAGQRPSALHNNCSGKHAGFICFASHMHWKLQGYTVADHPVQREVTAALGDLSGCNMVGAPSGIDGCGIPAFALPLRALAQAFARFGSGHGLQPGRARAAFRLRSAVAANPFMVAGTGRFDTDLAQALGPRVYTKTGAEGVACAALPEHGFGIAIKCDDGAIRAAELVTAVIVARFLDLSDEVRASLAPRLEPVVRNWAGQIVGHLRPTPALS